MEMIHGEYYWIKSKRTGYVFIGNYEVADYGDGDIEYRFFIIASDMTFSVNGFEVLSHIENPYK